MLNSFSIFHEDSDKNNEVHFHRSSENNKVSLKISWKVILSLLFIAEKGN